MTSACSLEYPTEVEAFILAGLPPFSIAVSTDLNKVFKRAAKREKEIKKSQNRYFVYVVSNNREIPLCRNLGEISFMHAVSITTIPLFTKLENVLHNTINQFHLAKKKKNSK